MNKIASIVFTMLTIVYPHLNAKTPAGYISMFEPDKVWIYEVRHPKVSDREDYSAYVKDFKFVSVAGDTIVNSRKAVRLQVITKDRDADITYTAAYEEDGRIYELDEKGRFVPTMDFGAYIGDRIEHYTDGKPDGTYMKVTGEEIVQINGMARRMLTIDNSWYWIEGVGAYYEDGEISSIDRPGQKKPLYLIRCFKGDKCIYEDTAVFDVDCP